MFTYASKFESRRVQKYWLSCELVGVFSPANAVVRYCLGASVSPIKAAFTVDKKTMD